MTIITSTRKNGKLSLTVDELLMRYELSKRADAQSEKTIKWYDEILQSFVKYLRASKHCRDLSMFNVGSLRDYIIYLQHKKSFLGIPTRHGKTNHSHLGLYSAT